MQRRQMARRGCPCVRQASCAHTEVPPWRVLLFPGSPLIHPHAPCAHTRSVAAHSFTRPRHWRTSSSRHIPSLCSLATRKSCAPGGTRNYRTQFTNAGGCLPRPVEGPALPSPPRATGNPRSQPHRKRMKPDIRQNSTQFRRKFSTEANHPTASTREATTGRTGTPVQPATTEAAPTPAPETRSRGQHRQLKPRPCAGVGRREGCGWRRRLKATVTDHRSVRVGGGTGRTAQGLQPLVYPHPKTAARTHARGGSTDKRSVPLPRRAHAPRHSTTPSPQRRRQPLLLFQRHPGRFIACCNGLGAAHHAGRAAADPAGARPPHTA